jgi:peroxiredoxin
MNSIVKSQPVSQEDWDKYQRIDKERIINVRPAVDTSAPLCMLQVRDAGKSPSKKAYAKQGRLLLLSDDIDDAKLYY